MNPPVSTSKVRGIDRFVTGRSISPLIDFGRRVRNTRGATRKPCITFPVLNSFVPIVGVPNVIGLVRDVFFCFFFKTTRLSASVTRACFAHRDTRSFYRAVFFAL